MQRARNLIGLAVKTPSGKRLGEVCDVLIDSPARRIVGLVINVGSFMRKPRYVRRADITDIADAVTVKNIQCLETTPIGGYGLDSTVSPVGKEVERPGVGDQGYIRDILVDTNRLSIWGFEISDGLVSDVLNGVSHLPRHEIKRLPGRILWATHTHSSSEPDDSTHSHE